MPEALVQLLTSGILGEVLQYLQSTTKIRGYYKALSSAESLCLSFLQQMLAASPKTAAFLHGRAGEPNGMQVHVCALQRSAA